MHGRHGYLVVSDLHLSLGRSPETGHLSRTEDFLFASEFGAFLEHHMGESQWRDVSWTLAINGDFMDFLQVTEVPEEPGILRVDPRYGLKAGPLESAWKVRRIVCGHERFFEKLVEFLEQHRLVIISGNHDAEFNYPEVRSAFIEAVARIGEIDPQRLASRIDFRSWCYLDEQVYLEHGHQYDRLNSFRTVFETRLPRDPRLPETEQDDLELPLGSLFVRYLFNRVETVSPIADNIKPPTRFLTWFFLHQPLEAIRFAISDGREVLRRVRRKWRYHSTVGYAGRDRAQAESLAEFARSLPTSAGGENSAATWSERLRRLHSLGVAPILLPGDGWASRLLRQLVGPIRTPILLGSFLAILAAGLILTVTPLLAALLPSPLAGFGERGLLAAPGTLLDALRWLFLAEIVGLLMIRLLKPDSRLTIRHRLRRKAREIQQLTRVRFVLMGHTHDPDLWKLADGALYLNTGTWTKVFSDQDRVLREERELTFVRLVETPEGLKAKLLKWEGRLGVARLAYVFEDPGRDL